MVDVAFYYDFGSPNAYLVHCVLPALEARTGVGVTYVPVLLGGLFKLTGNQAPGTAFAHIKGKLAYEQLEFNRFCQRHGIAFQMNPYFPVNTLNLMRGAIAAQQLGCGEDYIRSIFIAMWQEPRNMADPEIFAATLKTARLPADAILAAISVSEVKAQLQRNTEAAAQLGMFGSPSLMVGDELFFGKERLGQVEEEINRQLRKS
ncbi:MAG: 2-hydroxychromene-2-carboxylate isomerase [Rhizomicrobium sp.]